MLDQSRVFIDIDARRTSKSHLRDGNLVTLLLPPAFCSTKKILEACPVSIVFIINTQIYISGTSICDTSVWNRMYVRQ